MRKLIKKDYQTIDEYIGVFPKETQIILKNLRETIKKAAPVAQEKISYGIPTFTLHGNLVHFAAFKEHIGFYPTPSAITAFQKELFRYKKAKGSVQFLLNEPLPLALIAEMVKFRVKQNSEQKNNVWN